VPDIFLYTGEPNASDIKLRDPTVAAGGGGPATITADLAVTEAQDIAAFSAALVHQASLAATEGQDTAAFSAALVHTAALAAIEAQDVAAFSGALVHVADIAATEAQDVANFAATVIPADEQTADTHDGKGVGGALIQYKRPHKKVYDEINEYFDLRTAAEAEQAVDAIAEAAQETVSAHDRAARSGIAALLDEKRNAELRALLALAQDEDDAEAVLVMLELS
jgi:hypothetical protein